jgi:hypothetical protein
MYVAKNCFYHISTSEAIKNSSLVLDYNSIAKGDKCNEIQVYPSELSVELTGYYDLPYQLKKELKLLGFRESKEYYRYIFWRTEPFSEEFKKQVEEIVVKYIVKKN